MPDEKQDPAPVAKVKGKHRFRVERTTDPRHVILQGVADTEGAYDTVNLWDSAVVSFGIGQWTLIHGKLQAFLAYVRANHPKTFARVFQKGVGIDLPKQRRAYDLRLIVGGRTLARRKGETHDAEWAEFEEVFRPGGLGKPYRERDDSKGARAWIKRFVEAGKDPVVQQCQYEFKTFELVKKFFRHRLRVTSSRKYPSKFGERGLRPAKGVYGTMHQVVGGDLWLQTLVYNLYVNAPYMAVCLVSGAIQDVARARGWAPDVATWPARSKWRDALVEAIERATASCTYRAAKRKGKPFRPWRDSRLPKALRAYQRLTGDRSEFRNQAPFDGLRFDRDGALTGPRNSLRGFARIRAKLERAGLLK
ncbi:MAG: hypothetical protein JKY65_22445 [Planctomycetes bacterium]|nr:hypothetical protein [Planctomycetota bacterium]